MPNVTIGYVALGSYAARNWQDVPAPRIPAGTDVKITFFIRGYKPEEIEAAFEKLKSEMRYMVASYVDTLAIECWVVIGRQNTPAMVGGLLDNEFTMSVRDKLRELLGLRACPRCNENGWYNSDGGRVEPCDEPGCYGSGFVK